LTFCRIKTKINKHSCTSVLNDTVKVHIIIIEKNINNFLRYAIKFVKEIYCFHVTLTCFTVCALPPPVTVAVIAGREVRAVVGLVPTIATVCSSWILTLVVILTIRTFFHKIVVILLHSMPMIEK